MGSRSELSVEFLKSQLVYDPDTGLFFWLTPGIKRRIGDLAGKINKVGYVMISFQGKAFFAHRLAWMYVHGHFPPVQTDHINGVRHDNRIVNLRACTSSENHQSAARQVGVTGFRGVSKGKWGFRAEIGVGGRQYNLGNYETPEEAHGAYLRAKANMHTFQPTPRIPAATSTPKEQKK